MKHLSYIQFKKHFFTLIIFILITAFFTPQSLFAMKEDIYDNNNPEIFDSKLFIVAGLHMLAADQTGDEVAQFWKIYHEKKNQIPVDAPNIWGVKFNRKVMDGKTYFSYVIGKEVPRENDIPKKFGQLEVEPHKYAMFVHNGNIDSIASMYEFIYKTWFKSTPFIIDTKAPILEKMIDVENDPDPKVYIYIPIMKNSTK